MEQLVENFKHLFSKYRAVGKEMLELHIVGGEPTLWPKLGEFVTEIRKHIPAYITISSNGSRTLRWWEKFGTVFDKILPFWQIATAVSSQDVSIPNVII